MDRTGSLCVLVAVRDMVLVFVGMRRARIAVGAGELSTTFSQENGRLTVPSSLSALAGMPTAAMVCSAASSSAGCTMKPWASPRCSWGNVHLREELIPTTPTARNPWNTDVLKALPIEIVIQPVDIDRLRAHRRPLTQSTNNVLSIHDGVNRPKQTLRVTHPPLLDTQTILSRCLRTRIHPHHPATIPIQLTDLHLQLHRAPLTNHQRRAQRQLTHTPTPNLATSTNASSNNAVPGNNT